MSGKTLFDPPLGPIDDICSGLCEASPMGKGIGFLTEDGAVKHYIHRVSADARPSLRTTSLARLLQGQGQKPTGSHVTRKDRLYIEATLASSVLQLDRTPWLKRQWKRSDIFFHVENGVSTMRSRAAVLHPYLSWKVQTKVEPSSALDPRILQTHLIRSEAVLNLGLTLLDLCFGKTLSELEEPEDLDLNELVTRLVTA